MKHLPAALLGGFFVLGAALAHDHGPGSWINNERLRDPVTGEWCCSLVDCREEPDNIEAVSNGYRVR